MQAYGRAPHILKRGSVISKTRYLCEHCLTERKKYNGSIFSVVVAMFFTVSGVLKAESVI
jgi:hypothetical protein